MNTLEMSATREMSPSARDISRYRRIPSVRVVEAGRWRKVDVIRKVKFFGVMVFASFLLLASISEGVRTGLKTVGGNAEASGNFMVPGNSASFVRNAWPVTYQAKPIDLVGMLREANRYRVDMARERNRLITSLLGYAERTAGRLAR